MNTKATPHTDDVGSNVDVDKAISGAEDMLKQAATATSEKAAELRASAMEQLKVLRVRMNEAQSAAVEKSRAAAHVTDEFVHDNPWGSIVVATCVGVVIGLLISRR